MIIYKDKQHIFVDSKKILIPLVWLLKNVVRKHFRFLKDHKFQFPLLNSRSSQ